jgi:hypothetical protein
LGAGALATLVKTSGRYDYRIVEHTEERCTIRFLELSGDVLGESVFTLDDARRAGLAGRSTWKQYPRNMLFARALSNGVAWFCPDVSAGRVYAPEELDGAVIVENDVVCGEAVAERSADKEVPRPSEPIVTTTAVGATRVTILQRQMIGYLFKQLKDAAPQVDWASRCSVIAGVPSNELSEPGAEAVIEQMRLWLHELCVEALAEA